MEGDEDGAGGEWRGTARRVGSGARLDIRVCEGKDASSGSGRASSLELAVGEDGRVLEGS